MRNILKIYKGHFLPKAYKKIFEMYYEKPVSDMSSFDTVASFVSKWISNTMPPLKLNVKREKKNKKCNWLEMTTW